MHGPIRDRLEDLLAAAPSQTEMPGSVSSYEKTIAEHLAMCGECSSEFELMNNQSALLRSLRASEEQEPTAGFYARVVQRIEERTKNSIWSVFIYSPFGARLGVASLALAALLGTYVIGTEAKDGHLGSHNLVSDASFYGDQAQQRDAVLVNLVSSQGSLP